VQVISNVYCRLDGGGPALEFSERFEEQGSWNDDGGFAFSNLSLHIGGCEKVIHGVPDNDDFITFLALHDDWAAAVGVTACSQDTKCVFLH